MAGQKKKQTRQLPLLLLGLTGLALLLLLLLQGTDLQVLNPKGLIAHEQLKLIIFAVVVMLVIGVPTLFLLYYFAWKYRETSPHTTYNADIKHGKAFVFSVWAIPTVFMLILASVMWSSTHRLEPRRPIASNVKPLTIQVVALRWKWLFIYPDQNIATVNYVQVPVDTPVKFELTADEAPMNSFWIPHWGGQLYAMTGHSNILNLIAAETGEYQGSAAEINGAGFAGMKFMARASTPTEFDTWVSQVQQSQDVLDSTRYQNLLKPSENNQPIFYAAADQDLYDNVLAKYNGGGHDHAHQEAAYE